MSYQKLTPITAKGSTKPRYLEDRFADIINVKDYGAKGDGITDDTGAIKAAITAAKNFTVVHPDNTEEPQTPIENLTATGSPVIFFPHGRYLITEKIDFVGIKSLYLVLNNSVIVAGAQMTGMFYFNQCNVWGNKIEGGQFDMNNLAERGVWIDVNNKGFQVNNISIHHVGNGIGLALGDGGWVTNSNGAAHTLKDIKIFGTLQDEETYHGYGFVSTLGDMYVSDMLIYYCKTGIAQLAGGTSFNNIHIWNNCSPDDPEWKNYRAIVVQKRSNVFKYVYIDNYCQGIYVSIGVYVDNLFFFLPQTPSTVKHPYVVNCPYAGIVHVQNFICQPTEGYEINPLYLRGNESSQISNWQFLYLLKNKTIRFDTDNIRNKDLFYIFSPAFNIAMSGETYSPYEDFTDAYVTSGYYLLGYCLKINGEFDISVGMNRIMRARATIHTSIEGNHSSTMRESWWDSPYFKIAIGEPLTPSVYQPYDVLPVYLKMEPETGSHTYVTVFIKIHDVSLQAFYMIKTQNMNAAKVSNPNIDYEFSLTMLS